LEKQLKYIYYMGGQAEINKNEWLPAPANENDWPPAPAHTHIG